MRGGIRVAQGPRRRLHACPACDVIGMTATSVAAVVFLGAIVPRVEMKEPTTTTAVTMNEAHRDKPSTPPSNPRPREGEG